MVVHCHCALLLSNYAKYLLWFDWCRVERATASCGDEICVFVGLRPSGSYSIVHHRIFLFSGKPCFFVLVWKSLHRVSSNHNLFRSLAIIIISWAFLIPLKRAFDKRTPRTGGHKLQQTQEIKKKIYMKCFTMSYSVLRLVWRYRRQFRIKNIDNLGWKGDRLQW